MSDGKLSIADYPLAEKRPEIVRGKRGKRLDEITLDGVACRPRHASRICASPPRRCASRRRSPAPPGGRRWPQNFERAAELVDVPQDFDHAVYELLRPGRAQVAGGASRSGRASCASSTEPSAWRASCEEAAEVYERRGLFTKRF